MEIESLKKSIESDPEMFNYTDLIMNLDKPVAPKSESKPVPLHFSIKAPVHAESGKNPSSWSDPPPAFDDDDDDSLDLSGDDWETASKSKFAIKSTSQGKGSDESVETPIDTVSDEASENDAGSSPHLKIMPTRGSLRKGLMSQKLKYKYGAPVLTDPVNIYCTLIMIILMMIDIYYGTWKDQAGKDALENLMKGIDKTSWYAMMKDYYYQESETAPKVFVSGEVNFRKAVTDHYSLGKNLTDGDIARVIQTQIDSKALPEDESAVYFVLTSPDVDEGFEGASFGREYCGYHLASRMRSGKKIFFSMVGHPEKYLDGCGADVGHSKNSQSHAWIDSMASSMAHELVEAVSDPDDEENRAWEDGEGNGNCTILLAIANNRRKWRQVRLQIW